MILTPAIHFNSERYENTGSYYDDEYNDEAPPNTGNIKTLKLVDFVIHLHLNAEYLP